MFWGFAQFGKQLENSRKNFQKQDRKSYEKWWKKTLKKHVFFINFHDFFRYEKCMDFFMYFSWKMGSKMEPKTILKSFKDDFGRSKGRPGPIVNVFRSKMSTWRLTFSRPLASFFRLGSRTVRGGTPETDFDAILDASLVKNDVFLTPFWRHWWHFLSKSFKNGLQNHETNIKIAKASSPHEDSNLHVND